VLGTASDAQTANWGELQHNIAFKIACVCLVSGWFYAYGELSSASEDLRPIVLALVTGNLCMLLVLIKRLPASWVPLGQAVLTFIAAWSFAFVFGHRSAVPFFVVPVILSAFSVSPRSGAFFAALSCIALAMQARSDQVLSTCSFLALVGVLVVLQARELQLSLHQAWRDSQHASILARELGFRQEEVNRLNRSLQLSNELLKRTNRELAVARREAEDGRRLKAEFAANISHELRTPLNLILGFTEIMSRAPEIYGDVNWTPTLRRDLSEIRRSARYLSELVDDILDLARIDAFRMPVHREFADLSQVIYEATDIVRRLLADKPVELQIDIQSGLPQLFMDKTRIRQVLLNLLTNAIRFTDTGSIRVQARLDRDSVIVAVQDTGPGIPEDQLDKIFDEFEQIGAWRYPGDRGKGLGLAIAKHLIQLHAGRIWVESKQGEGSTFYFTLPLSVKQVARLRQCGSSPLPSPVAVPTVVVLDEDEVAATRLERHLDGYAITLARDAAEACQLIADLHPDGVIVNLPPEQDAGVRAFANLGLPEAVPIIGVHLPSSRWLAQDERFTDYLTKPVTTQEVLAMVDKLAPIGEVLVVDDEPGFIQFMERTFQAAGQMQRLRCASCGKEALAAMWANKPALVLLDLMLPDMDGFSVADAVRSDERLRDVPIVAVSGASLGEDALAMFGDSLVVTKPNGFQGEEFLNLVRAVLALVKPAYGGGSPSAHSSTAVAKSVS